MKYIIDTKDLLRQVKTELDELEAQGYKVFKVKAYSLAGREPIEQDVFVCKSSDGYLASPIETMLTNHLRKTIPVPMGHEYVNVANVVAMLCDFDNVAVLSWDIIQSDSVFFDTVEENEMFVIAEHEDSGELYVKTTPTNQSVSKEQRIWVVDVKRNGGEEVADKTRGESTARELHECLCDCGYDCDTCDSCPKDQFDEFDNGYPFTFGGGSLGRRDNQITSVVRAIIGVLAIAGVASIAIGVDRLVHKRR